VTQSTLALDEVYSTLPDSQLDFGGWKIGREKRTEKRMEIGKKWKNTVVQTSFAQSLNVTTPNVHLSINLEREP